MATNLAKLVVQLEAETAKYQKELEKAKRDLGLFEKKSQEAVTKIAKAAGAAAIAAALGFAAMARAAIDTADNLNDLSKQTGISVESLSRLSYAAKLSGTDIEGIARGLQRLTASMADAAQGLKAPADAFKMLGVSVKNADGTLRDSQDMLLDIADVFSQYEDGAAKAALAQEVFGKSGLQLIPFLNQGRAGIEQLTKEADRLGITISGKTAAAADEFNDNLERLKSAGVGLANQVASQLLPMLESLSANFAGAATEGQAFSEAADVIAAGLKLIVSSGLIVAEVFDRVGEAIGAAAAAIIATLQGEFRRAIEIQVDYWKQSSDSVSETANQLAAVWSSAGKKIEETANKTDAALKKSFAFGGAADKIQEVQITAKRIEEGPNDALLRQLNDATKTQNERALSNFYEQREALRTLWEEGVIGVEQYNARLSEMQDELLPEFEVTVKKVKEVAEKSTTELTVFQEQAMRNTQDIIADALVNGFDDGAKGILKSFANMLIEMTAQAVAADIAGKLFGSKVSGNSSDGSGWINAALSIFGGFMANGGNVSPNEAYVVGEQGPEMFVPNTAGKIVPNHEMGGGGMTVNFALPPGANPASMETQTQIANRMAAALAAARRRNG